MQEIAISSVRSDEVLTQLNQHLKGELKHQWGEYTLQFDNEFGKGIIRSIAFDWGVSLLDYDVHFLKDLKIILDTTTTNPIEFIFVSEGNLQYASSEEDTLHYFERYQNIIISTKANSRETYIFPGKTDIKVNFIYVQQKEYAKKKNNNLSYLNKNLLAAFQKGPNDPVYSHFGNLNLKIADQIKQLQEGYNHGIIRTLSIEGQLNLIMAMQILEHDTQENGNALPDSLSKAEIRKIHELSAYILDNIAEPLSVRVLAEKSGLNEKKLQMGFRLIYSKSVNEYVRQLKLELSRDYIKDTNDSISEIVYKIGLKSRSYFSKIFYEKYGILPTEYRKKIKINAS